MDERLSGLFRRILPHGINFRFSFVEQGLSFKCFEIFFKIKSFMQRML